MADSQKDLDIIEIIKEVVRSILFIFNKILQFVFIFVVFCLRRIHFILLFIIIGILLGLSAYKLTKRYYTSEMIAQPNGISSRDIVTYINDINSYCKRRNYEGLANALKIDDSLALEIKMIEAFHYIDLNLDGEGDIVDYYNKYNPKDTTTSILDNRFLLRVELFDNKDFSIIKNGILKYIEKNPYMAQLNTLRKLELKERILNLSDELIKMDSLQNVEYFQIDNRTELSSRSQLTIMAEKEKPLYYNDKIYILNKKQEYQKELELSEAPIIVIKDFSELIKAENNLFSYILKYSFLVLFVGLVILILHKNKEKVKKYIQENMQHI